MLTADDYKACENYCFKRAWRLRLMPQASRRLIGQALELMALPRRKPGDGTHEWLAECLAIRLIEHYDVARPKSSSLLIWLLLQIILPIVVRLVIEWFANREGREEWKP